MNADLVLQVNRRYVSLYYAQTSGGFKVFEFDGAIQIPLSFYSEGLTFEVGRSAHDRYSKSNPDAYSDYFNLIKDTERSFTYLGERKPLKDLFVKGLERIINAFLKEVLLRKEKVSDLKTKLKLNLVFSTDVKENEVLFIGELLRDEGFVDVKGLYYDYLLLNYFDLERKIGSFEGYIVVGGIAGDLFIDYYRALEDKIPKHSLTGKDLANDPRDKIIAKLLFDKAVLITGAVFSKGKQEAEVQRLIDTAKKYSGLNKAMFYVPVELSDGSSCKVRIRQNQVDDILDYQSDFTKDFDLVRDCERKSTLRNSDLQIIVKRTISSELFKDRLRQYYNNVFVSDTSETEVFQLFRTNQVLVEAGNIFESTIADESGSESVKSTRNLSGPSSNVNRSPKSGPNIPKSIRPIQSLRSRSSISPPPPPPAPPPVERVKNSPKQVPTPRQDNVPRTSQKPSVDNGSKPSKPVAPRPPSRPPTPPPPPKPKGKR